MRSGDAGWDVVQMESVCCLREGYREGHLDSHYFASITSSSLLVYWSGDTHGCFDGNLLKLGLRTHTPASMAQNPESLGEGDLHSRIASASVGWIFWFENLDYISFRRQDDSDNSQSKPITVISNGSPSAISGPKSSSFRCWCQRNASTRKGVCFEKASFLFCVRSLRVRSSMYLNCRFPGLKYNCQSSFTKPRT